MPNNQKPFMNKKKRPTRVASGALLGGMTREQTLADHQALMSSLSQPRAVLFLIREPFEQVPENACSSQIMLIDSGIRTLTFLIGDKKYKAGKR